MPNLQGKVCLVTGASRGVGKGIALQLAINGATCYITGRSLEKLNLVSKEAETREACGKCIPIQCDHSDDAQVKQVFEQIANKNDGQLDLLVNNAYSAVNWVIENGQYTFWDQPEDGWDIINNVGLRNHYKCAVHASRLMIKQRKGLIVNISSIGGVRYFQTPCYGIGKTGKDRMARDCAVDLAPYNVAFVSLWPGPVRTEAVDAAIKTDAARAQTFEWLFENGESAEFSGKCIASLLVDQDIMKRTGQIVLSTDIAAEFNILDVDGRFPVSIRSLKSMVVSSGALWLAPYIPSFIRVPLTVFTFLAASRSVSNVTKIPSKYS